MREFKPRKNQAARRAGFVAAVAAAILLLWAPDAARADEIYEAVLSCTHQEKTVDVMDCLDNGELVVESKGRTRTYFGEHIPRTVQYGQTLRIPLSIKFHIFAESSNRQQLLHLVVVDYAGNVIFRDDSGRHNLVMAKNR